MDACDTYTFRSSKLLHYSDYRKERISTKRLKAEPKDVIAEVAEPLRTSKLSRHKSKAKSERSNVKPTYKKKNQQAKPSQV